MFRLYVVELIAISMVNTVYKGYLYLRSKYRSLLLLLNNPELLISVLNGMCGTAFVLVNPTLQYYILRSK